jgi:hypothetical protein
MAYNTSITVSLHVQIIRSTQEPVFLSSESHYAWYLLVPAFNTLLPKKLGQISCFASEQMIYK